MFSVAMKSYVLSTHAENAVPSGYMKLAGKSYATEVRLMKEIESLGFASLQHVVCKTIDDRFTAIFIGADKVNLVLGAGFAIVG